MPTPPTDALRRVLDYVQPDEERDAAIDASDGHIVEDLRALRRWLDNPATLIRVTAEPGGSSYQRHTLARLEACTTHNAGHLVTIAQRTLADSVHVEDLDTHAGIELYAVDDDSRAALARETLTFAAQRNVPLDGLDADRLRAIAAQEPAQ